jgi:hypothetical protein
VEELGGLIFAYLGTGPTPLLPRWDLYAMDNVVRDVGATMIPCNVLARPAQGPIVDRSVEQLAGSDRGLLLYRRMLLEEIEKCQRGEDPINVFRDPSKNEYIPLATHDYGHNMTLNMDAVRRKPSGNFSPITELLEEMYSERTPIAR